MRFERHLTWENFERDIVKRAVPATHPVPGTPDVRVFLLTSPLRIGLAVALSAPVPPPTMAYRQIEVEVQMGGQGPVLAVWTRNKNLFRPFFSVLLEIADAVQLEHEAPNEAVQVAIERFATVIRPEVSFTQEQVTGFWGELQVLEWLLRREGASRITCWTGWRADQHDFRIDSTELEIKATLRGTPEHVINGLGQLMPSQGCTLYVMSLQLMRTDTGQTLGERLQAIENIVRNNATAIAVLADAREALDLTAQRLDLCQERLALRCEPVLVPVDILMPRLTPDVLRPALGDTAYARLLDAHYRVNFVGLGISHSSPAFHKVLPWA